MTAYRLEPMDEPGLYRIVIADTGQPVMEIDYAGLRDLFRVAIRLKAREFEIQWTKEQAEKGQSND